MNWTPSRALMLAFCALLMGQEECDEPYGTPTPGDPTPLPDGELYSEVDNPAPLTLLPITEVRFRPIGADSTTVEFSTAFTITTEAGTLSGATALDWLGLNFNISTVLLTCLDGTPLLFETFDSCSGSTVEEQQTRVMYLVGTALGGVLLDPEVVAVPFLSLEMTEEVQTTALPGLQQAQRAAPGAEQGGRSYVQDMGMHW